MLYPIPTLVRLQLAAMMENDPTFSLLETALFTFLLLWGRSLNAPIVWSSQCLYMYAEKNAKNSTNGAIAR